MLAWHSNCTGPLASVELSRRQLLARAGMGLGSLALAHLFQGDARAARRGVLDNPHFTPRARRIIYLFQSGGPSQLDLFDYKPRLLRENGKQLPASVRQGQRLTGMSAFQSSLPLAAPKFSFARYGQSGAWVSELLPHTARVADDLCFIKSMHTEAINHDPAITFLQTGSQIAGRPSLGAWIHYGLGTDNENLPAFVVLVTKGKQGQPLYSRLWGSAFLPTRFQGVRFRDGKDAVLYLSNAPGIDRHSRRMMLDCLQRLHEAQRDRRGDAAIDARIEQYEMAYRMQTSVPDVMNIRDEPSHVYNRYGPDVRTPGTFAANCLLARRLAERGVKFIQLYHQGWDQHSGLPAAIRTQCRETDQASTALLEDLKERGMLDDTLVVWGGEFGRTNYSQGKLTATDYGRDHHPRSFTMWLAGGGVRAGISYGQTCPYGYNIVENGVHVHDLQATLLYLLGIDHERLTYKFQGRRYRLTDVSGRVVKDIVG